MNRFNADQTIHEIRTRLIDPKKLIKTTFFTRQSTTPGVKYIMGQDRKSGKFLTQAIHFDNSIFDLAAAKRWFKANIKRIKDRDMKSYPQPVPYYTAGVGNFRKAMKKRLFG